MATTKPCYRYRRDQEWTTWVRFFLTAVRTHAEEDLARIEGILALHDDLMWRLPEITRSRHVVAALDRLFRQPIFTRTGFARRAGIPTFRPPPVSPSGRALARLLRHEGLNAQGEQRHMFGQARGQADVLLDFDDYAVVIEAEFGAPARADADKRFPPDQPAMVGGLPLRLAVAVGYPERLADLPESDTDSNLADA